MFHALAVKTGGWYICIAARLPMHECNVSKLIVKALQPEWCGLECSLSLLSECIVCVRNDYCCVYKWPVRKGHTLICIDYNSHLFLKSFILVQFVQFPLIFMALVACVHVHTACMHAWKPQIRHCRKYKNLNILDLNEL